MNYYKENPNGSYRGDNFVGVSKERGGFQFYSCERDYLDELEETEEEHEQRFYNEESKIRMAINK